ncbi:glycosyltransferase family 4 protein [Candidatus Odyssella thessalonicensis]|uniref:glycosyltransferase family 4 protein n=1 Tax=Candidatus Odyssella thessalonicensis TaxID=84647 RepID=UPI000225A8F7|nr:glycosyltransferase family 4 protein [Candidatus Odyssella thessalonicensis]
MTEPQSLLILSNDSKSLLDFRWSFVQQCRRQGWQVTIACNPDTYFAKLQEHALQEKIPVFPLDFSNGGINPFQDLTLIVRMRQLYQLVCPSHVLLYRIKPVLYGSLASYGLPIKVISTITGLGYVYTDLSLKARCLRVITNGLYKLALRRNSWVFFQNKDDQQTFIEQRLITADKCSVVGGSGVCLNEFPFTPLPDTLSFVMVARLLKDKGIWEYLQAASQLKKLYPQIDFRLVGGSSNNPAAIPLAEIQEFCRTHRLSYLGQVDRIHPILQQSSVFVLPSYREGMPRAGLEALSTGRPIITTDTQGCRDLIDHNGFKVPIKNAAALMQAMRMLIEQPELLPPMAQASRHLAEKVFDVHHVNQAMMTKING